MATQTRTAGTGASDASNLGTGTWNNPGNVASNVSFANVFGTNGLETEWIKATNFGFSIPAGATIDGIDVSFSAYMDTMADVYVDKIKMVRDTGGGWVPQGTSNVIGGSLSDSPSSYGGGNSAELWGLSGWTPAVINDSSFGVAITFNALTWNPGAYIGNVQITVYYTPGITIKQSRGRSKVRAGTRTVR